MTPTAHAMSEGQRVISTWLPALGFVLLAALIAVCLATGAIRLNPRRRHHSGARVVLSLDAAISPRGRKEAIEHLLNDQQQVVMDEPQGDDNPGGEPGRVLFEYPDEPDHEPEPPV